MRKSYFYLVLSYTELVLSIVSSVILARFLGVSDFGILQTYILICTLILPSINFKFDEVLVKDIKSKDCYYSVNKYILTEYVLVVLAYGLVYFFFDEVTALFNLDVGTLPPVIILYIAFAYMPTALDGFLRSIGKELFVQKIKTLSALVSLLGAASLLLFDLLTYSYAFFIIIGCRFILLICFYSMYLKLKPKGKEIKSHFQRTILSDGLLATLNNMLSIALKSGSIFAAVLMGPAAVAIYRVSDSISQLAYFSATALYRLNFSSVMGVKQEKNKNTDKLVAIIVLINFLGIVVLLKPVLALVYGPDYEGAYYPTLILAFSYVLCGFIYNAPAYAFKKANGLQYQIKVRVLFLLFLLPLCYWCVTQLGVVGLALAIGFVRIGIMCVFHYGISQK